MQTRILFIVSAFILFALSSLQPGNAFSQSGQQESNTKANENVLAKKQEDSTYVKGITTGRAKALVGGVMGLMSLVVGWSAKKMSGVGKTRGRTAAVIALWLGLGCVLFSVWHLGTSAGAVFGSGSGKAGAIVALLVGCIGIIVSWLALRNRKVDSA